MILDDIINKSKNGKPSLAVLIDPDKQQPNDLLPLIKLSEQCGVSYFFVGGSLLTETQFEDTIHYIKGHSTLPIIIFPGSGTQVSSKADGILLLSMISGRNPELLIGQHVLAAPRLKSSGIDILPTGYILIDGGKPTTVSYISNTNPIPADKPDIAAVTAMAGEMLGLKLMYLDAGSGAQNPVSSETISAVKNAVDSPIIVGGGIKSPEAALTAIEAGADVLVVGNVLEKSPDLLLDISRVFQSPINQL